MSVSDFMAAARNEAFSQRVSFTLMKAAIDIANEDPSTTNHANRLAFSQKHFKSQIDVKAVALGVIASNPTIQASINSSPTSKGANVTDGDLEFVTNGLIDNFAKAYAAE